MKPRIILFVGMIASGKSSYARRLAQEGYLIVNDDAIVNMVHGGDYTLYDKELKMLYKSTESHVVHTGVIMGRSVVVDRGVNMRYGARKRWIGIASSLDVPITAVVFPMEKPDIHAKRRVESNARGHDLDYWYDVACEHMMDRTMPTSEEGFDGIIELKEGELKECLRKYAPSVKQNGDHENSNVTTADTNSESQKERQLQIA